MRSAGRASGKKAAAAQARSGVSNVVTVGTHGRQFVPGAPWARTTADCWQRGHGTCQRSHRKQALCGNQHKPGHVRVRVRAARHTGPNEPELGQQCTPSEQHTASWYGQQPATAESEQQVWLAWHQLAMPHELSNSCALAMASPSPSTTTRTAQARQARAPSRYAGRRRTGLHG